MASPQRRKLVVVGLGMVGIAFIEKVIKLDSRAREYEVTVIGDEPHVAYNRVGLTSFFTHRKIENLYLNQEQWYKTHAEDKQLAYHVNTRVVSIDSQAKTVLCANDTVLAYDVLVMATGSSAARPTATPGYDAEGVFVYRTIDDLQRLIAFGENRPQPKQDGETEQPPRTGVVVGGGLLGLEAASAMLGMGPTCFDKVSIVERNKWVLSRQLDGEAGRLVVEKVSELGIDVQLGKRVAKINTDDENRVAGLVFEGDGGEMPCSALCFAIGIKPRDELAQSAGIKCADRGGGIIVKDDLSTSAADIYAIGECASFGGETFGLIAPGIEMADVLAFNLTQAKLHQPRAFKRPDLSTKLKLLGVDVASFGDFFADRDGPKSLPAKASRLRGAKSQSDGSKQVQALVYKDPFAAVYKKYIFTADGKYLLGGMMVGDTKDYIKVTAQIKKQKELDMPPSQLIIGASKDGEDDSDDLDADTQICACHNVSKGDIIKTVTDGTCKSVGEMQTCTKAGTGCGGCVPQITSIFNKAMAAAGGEIKNHLCAHFAYSRAELYTIVQIRHLRSFQDVMEAAGVQASSEGCEVCKPGVASIFASLWNEPVLKASLRGLQDTNDRYLGNVQRDGTYSVVPRVAGGEITPSQLVAIGEVAREFGLYTKITGGQRIDMFGARRQDLLSIWRRLGQAGLECGQAYAKSVRTVKSCVGSTWCRYGVGDSVGMAVRVEARYKGIRSPHKLKGGVSGCVRECAEAQSKDFGLIATEKGFNIYIAGNGGANPKHAELLARDVPPVEVIPILDRYLMFYIRTADKLQRTARWLEALGDTRGGDGLSYLRDVILNDSLGICASLEAQMQALVDSYFDEWAEAVRLADQEEDSTRKNETRQKFQQFANTSETLEIVERETERGQPHPVFWPENELTPPPSPESKDLSEETEMSWQPVIEASYFAQADSIPNGMSAAIKVPGTDTQLALWRVRGRYFASQQMCPHKRTFALSEGFIGSSPCSSPDSSTAENSNPYITCPFHKRTFSLSDGACKNDTTLPALKIFEAEERDDDNSGKRMVYIKLPPPIVLDAMLGTTRWKVKKGEAPGRDGAFVDLDTRFGARDGEIFSHRKGRRGRKVGGGGSNDGDADDETRDPGSNGRVQPLRGNEVDLVNSVGCHGMPEW